MDEMTRPGDLVMQWIPVVDALGRTHMEARWSVVPETHTPDHAVQAVHAVSAA